MRKIITGEFLESWVNRPCEDQLKIFNRLWPNGCEVTRANIRKALRHRLEIRWFMSNYPGKKKGKFLFSDEQIEDMEYKLDNAWRHQKSQTDIYCKYLRIK